MRPLRVLLRSWFGPVLQLGDNVADFSGRAEPGPMPIFPGARVENSGHGGGFWRVQFHVAAEPAEVLAFYERAFVERGLTVARPDGRRDLIQATGPGVDAGAVTTARPKGGTDGVVYWRDL